MDFGDVVNLKVKKAKKDFLVNAGEESSIHNSSSSCE